jgi:hypothetical protein
MKFLEFGQRIVHMQQGPIPVMARSLVQQSWRNVQINDPPRLTQSATILGIDDNAATRCQHQIDASGEVVNSLRLATTKAILTLNFKDGGNRDSSPFDNFVIRIQKWPA